MEGREKIKIQENNGFDFGEGFHFDLVGVILDEILYLRTCWPLVMFILHHVIDG